MPRADLIATTRELASAIAAKPRAAARAAKQLVLASTQTSLAEGLALEMDTLLDLLDAR